MIEDGAWTPFARNHELLVESVGNEIVVYDALTDRAHCLNSLASAVWVQCDGRTSVEALASSVSAVLTTDLSVDEIRSALIQLHQADLLVDGSPLSATRPGLTRRSFLKRAGAAAALGASLPMIVSIVAPTAAAAASSPACLPAASVCQPGLGHPQCCAPFTCQQVGGGVHQCV